MKLLRLGGLSPSPILKWEITCLFIPMVWAKIIKKNNVQFFIVYCEYSGNVKKTVLYLKI